MLLGKRPRPALSRTKSSAEFPAAAIFDVEAPPPADDDENTGGEDSPPTRNTLPHGASELPHSGIVSGDVVEEEDVAAGTASFLRTCGLCERRLGPGRDIYMYRGDIAFCSFECRQQQMNLDEQKKKCSLVFALHDERFLCKE